MTATEFLFLAAAFLASWGLLTAWIAGRLARDRFEWWILGAALGPLSLPALVASVRESRRNPPEPRPLGPVTQQGGPRVLAVAADRAGLVAAASAVQRRLGWSAPAVTLALLAKVERAPTSPYAATHLEEVGEAMEPRFERAALELPGLVTARKILFGELHPAVVAELHRGDYWCAVVGRRGRASRRTLPRLALSSPCPVLVAGACVGRRRSSLSQGTAPSLRLPPAMSETGRG